MKLHYAFLAVAAVAALSATPAKAQDLLSLGVGYYDILDQENEALDLRAEYRFDKNLIWKIKPWLGMEANTDGSLYGAGGFLADFDIGNNWYVAPNVGVGVHAHGGGKNLGFPIEFRSQIEAGYKFVDQSRVGVAFGHISNASLGDKNPGVEILDIYYHVPVNWF